MATAWRPWSDAQTLPCRWRSGLGRGTSSSGMISRIQPPKPKPARLWRISKIRHDLSPRCSASRFTREWKGAKILRGTWKTVNGRAMCAEPTLSTDSLPKSRNRRLDRGHRAGPPALMASRVPTASSRIPRFARTRARRTRRRRSPMNSATKWPTKLSSTRRKRSTLSLRIARRRR